MYYKDVLHLDYKINLLGGLLNIKFGVVILLFYDQIPSNPNFKVDFISHL